MSLSRIFLFCTRAITFALPVTLFFCFVRLLLLRKKGEKLVLKTELLYAVFCFYLSALIQITVIRGGVDLHHLLTLERSTKTIQPIPIIYTLLELKNGLWAFLYPVLGNILWFLPLGVMLPLLKPCWKKWLPLCLTGFLLSFGIEVFQWFFGSGISDIDDILLNTLGTLLPQAACTIYHSRLKRSQKERNH